MQDLHIGAEHPNFQANSYIWIPVYQHGFAEIMSWISNYIHCFARDAVTHTCTNVNDGVP